MDDLPVLKARHAALVRHRGAGDSAVLAARRELKAAGAAEYIRTLVDEAPELTAEQRDKLAGILRPTGSTAPSAPDPARAAARKAVLDTAKRPPDLQVIEGDQPDELALGGGS